MRLVIFGTGGMGRELMDVARSSQSVRRRYHDIIFAADPGPGTEGAGEIVISPHDLRPDDALCFAVGDPAARRALAERFGDRRFAMVLSDHAIVSPFARIDEGAAICHHAVVNHSASVGKHFQANCYAHVAHDCIIGDYVTFSPKASCNGWVTIGDGVFVGAGAVIRNGSRERRLTIGAGAVIGMGAVVVGDVAEGAIVTGIPARPVAPPARDFRDR